MSGITPSAPSGTTQAEFINDANIASVIGFQQVVLALKNAEPFAVDPTPWKGIIEQNEKGELVLTEYSKCRLQWLKEINPDTASYFHGASPEDFRRAWANSCCKI